MDDFKKLHQIYGMFSPGSEQAARVLGPDKTSDIFSSLQNTLINANDGIRTVEMLKTELEGLYSRNSTAGDSNLSLETRFHLNRYVSFYSSIGGLQVSGDAAPRSHNMWCSDNRTRAGETLEFHQIIGFKSDDDRLSKKPMSIIQSRTPFVSPATKDAVQVETFLNYMPSFIMSRCVPYLSVDFIFKRPVVDGAVDSLNTMGMYKFLLGGKEVNSLGSADKAIYDARSEKVDPAKDSGEMSQMYTSAGMEMFTAPQTLINMTPGLNDYRYINISDPTRPFATIENFSVEVKGTTGLMSFKTAQLVITVHDKSRLAEIADLVQPAVYGRSTLWITYGWRHPIDKKEAKDSSGAGANHIEAESYQEFINNKMLLKESYGISNAQFNFDLSGQVKLTLSLYTKSVEQMRRFTLADDMPFMRLRREQDRLSKEISEIKEKYKLEPPKGITKEIRPYVVISNAAAGLSTPNMDPKDVVKAIEELETAIANSAPNESSESQKTDRANVAFGLKTRLNKFYFGEPLPKNTKEFHFSAASKACATEFIKSKFDELSGPDPFLAFEEIDGVKKIQNMMVDFGLQNGVYPYASEMNSANLASVAAADPETQNLIQGLKSQVVSFGKLFSVFVLPMMYELEDVDECQLFFYNVNDFAGLASGTNIADFAIDLPEFLRQYNKAISANGSVNITVESFVKLVVASQLTDLRAIPFGFRSGQRDYFEKWTNEKSTTTISEAGEAKYAARALAVNLRRGAFTLPKIEVYVETTKAHVKHSDLLTLQGEEGLFTTQNSGVKNIMRIHVFDAAAVAYATEADTVKHEAARDGENRFKHVIKFMEFNPYTQESPPIIEPENLKEESEKEKVLTGRSAGIILEGGNSESRIVLMREMAKKMPVLIPGMNNSSIKEVTVSTNNDQQMSTLQMIRTENEGRVDAGPRGDGLPGMPLRIIPVTMEMKTLGCPHLNFSQHFYVDMNTGTDIDNSYGITSINHAISPGTFESSIKLVPVDAYPQYASAYSDLFKKEDEQKKALKTITPV